MQIALITGAAGLVGSAAVEFFSGKGFQTEGIDCDLRRYFFGRGASTQWNLQRLLTQVRNYHHHQIDIRDQKSLETIFAEYRADIKLIIHAAAQPSHDWAAQEPHTDFSINATGTLNLLEMTRRYAPGAVFIFVSTNKVYGDLPNALPVVELKDRFEIKERHRYYDGIDENLSVDQSKHSLFGVSKLSADILAQEYGRYFGMKTVCFRAGCLTGPNHSGAVWHGFLSYLMKCCMTGEVYTIFGYKGKQVRDNLHSWDLVNAFDQFYQNPRPGEVYNIGGGRLNSCSVREAIELCESLTGKKVNFLVQNEARVGDHIWYITSVRKFKEHYPNWAVQFDLPEILKQIYQNNFRRLRNDQDDREGGCPL